MRLERKYIRHSKMYLKRTLVCKVGQSGSGLLMRRQHDKIVIIYPIIGPGPLGYPCIRAF